MGIGSEPAIHGLMGARVSAQDDEPRKPAIGLNYLAQALTQMPKKVEVGSGQSEFEVHWSVNITQRRKLSSPRLEKFQFISNKWKEE